MSTLSKIKIIEVSLDNLYDGTIMITRRYSDGECMVNYYRQGNALDLQIALIDNLVKGGNYVELPCLDDNRLIRLKEHEQEIRELANSYQMQVVRFTLNNIIKRISKE